MKRTRNFYVGVTILAVVGVLAAVQFMLQPVAEAQAGNQAGIYQVDAGWPKPLPNNWVLGSTVGLSVDSRDHVWIVHRGQTGQDPKFMSQMTFPPAPARGARGAGARGAAPAAPAGRDAAIGEVAATG